MFNNYTKLRQDERSETNASAADQHQVYTYNNIMVYNNNDVLFVFLFIFNIFFFDSEREPKNYWSYNDEKKYFSAL